MGAALFPSFIETGIAGASRPESLPVSHRMGSLLPGGKDSGKSLIIVVLQGGVSHFDTFDPKTDRDVQGLFKRIRTKADGVYLTDQLPRMAKRMDKVLLLRNLFHTYTDHWAGTSFYLTGSPELNPKKESVQLSPFIELSQYFTRMESPDAGYVVMHHRDNSSYEGVSVMPYAGLHLHHPDTLYAPRNETLGRFVSPITAISDPARFAKMVKLSDQFDSGPTSPVGHTVERSAAIRRVALLRLQGELGRSFDLRQEPIAVREKYGTTGFGDELLIARRMVERGARVVVANHGNYDFHEDIHGIKHKTLLARLDQGISALIDDIHSRTLPVVVAVISEFGRTPRINRDRGRDHWPDSNSMLLFGHGIEPGLVGATGNNGVIIGPAIDAGRVGEFLLNLIGFARWIIETNERVPTLTI